MTAPVVQVLVGFQTTTGFGTPFLLNDAFFGVLDTAGRGTLGGIEFADLTSIVESVNVTRGRNRQLDQFNAGTATVSFYNASRILDPSNTASIFYPFVLPRCPIIILANNIPIYTGLITDWNLDYDLANQDMMYAACSDQFTVLANQFFGGFSTIQVSSSELVEAVLIQPNVLYQGPQEITTGSSTMGAFFIDADTNCLNYLQRITTSEQGYLYIAADGTLTFKGRTSVLNPVADALFTYDGTGIPYRTLLNEFGDELLYNNIVTESPAGVAQTVSNAESVALYQTQTYEVRDLLNATVTEVAALGQYLLGKYQNPVLRFNGLSTQLAALTETQQNVCLNLDLTDICTVTKNFVTGTPSDISQTLIVSGVNHNIVPGSHVISYTFEATDGNQYMTLDDSIFGTLNNNLLAF